MPQYKLTYFDVRALGEPIRWLLAYKGLPFEDERIPWDYPGWFQNRKKDYATNGGQIPVLTIDGGKRNVTQTIAIIRYLAGEHGLLGKDPWAEAQNDMVAHMIFDVFTAWRMLFFTPDAAKREQLKKGLLPGKGVDDMINLAYTKINKILEDSEGDFVAGKTPTWGDFFLASFTNIWDDPVKGPEPVKLPGMPTPTQEDYYLNLTEKYPALRKHKERVMALPEIKKWIDKRPVTMV